MKTDSSMPRESILLLLGGTDPDTVSPTDRKIILQHWLELASCGRAKRSALHHMAFDVIVQAIKDIWTPMTVNMEQRRRGRDPNPDDGFCNDKYGAEAILAGWLDIWLEVLHVQPGQFRAAAKRLGLL